MATYVNDLRLKEIGTGESSGTWGTETNVNLELIGEALGYATKALADASTGTLTIPDGTATNGEPRALYLKLTGGGQAQTVTLAPNTVSKTWIIDNGTSYTLTFSQGSGANVAIAAGKTKVIATDGAGSGAAIYDCFTDLELAGAVTAATSFTAPLIEGSTSVQTPLIEYTDGDDAITIADGGGLTFASTTQANGTVTVGVNDTGYDVKFFGATSGKYWLWDESADGVLQYSTLTVGVDDTGYDVKFFGATSGAYMLWDESADDLVLAGAAGLDIAGDIDVDGTANLDIVDIDGAVQIDGALTVGVDGTGLDVKFFGTTSGRYVLWDESNDSLDLMDSVYLRLGTGGDLNIFHNGTHNYINSTLSDADIVFKGNDGGSTITALTLDMSNDGAATFKAGVGFNGDTAAANMLDDYEEGLFAFSSVAIAGGTGSVAIDADNDQIAYTKIGDRVWINGNITIESNTANGGRFNFTGLPYASAAGTESSFATLFFCQITGGTDEQVSGFFCPLGGASSTVMKVQTYTGITTTNDSAVCFQADTVLYITGNYYV